MHGFEYFGAGWGMILIWLVPILLIALVLRLLLGGRDARSGQTPLDILKSRYARGEIDEEEFQRKKQELGS
ncbi:MAG: SHOCT domain-containing protein [Pseudomonadota bacterium]